MLCAPALWSWSAAVASLLGEYISPAIFPRDISAFWQYPQRREQPQKNIAPLPFVPDMGGYS